MKDLTQQSKPDDTASVSTHPSAFFLKNKNHLILLLLFLFYGFILIPLGDYKHPEVSHAGYYSIQRIDPGDDTGYYAYLRSGVIDVDFDFFNEKRYWHFDAITSTGYSANYWYLGQSLIWMPFFLIGHAIAWFYSLLGYPVATNGYSFPYHALTFIGSSCEVFIALIVCYECLKKFFSQRACLITTILIFSSTCLPYFTFIRNRMSHSGDLLAASIFFLFFLNFRENKKKPLSFFVLWGIFTGILFDLRFSNLVYLIFPLWFIFKSLVTTKTKDSPNKKRISTILLSCLAFVITTLPQWSTWWMLNDVPLPETGGMAIAVSPTLTSISNSLGNLFFSPGWGLAFTEPIWFLGVIGLIMFLRKDKTLGILSLLFFCGSCVVPVVLGNGASFGQRYLIPALPVLALGLAQFVDMMLNKRLQGLLLGLGFILSGWLYILLLNYNIILDFNTPDFAVRAFQNIPRIFHEMNLFRPTTYPNLLFNGNLKTVDFVDYFFLVFFPFLQVGLPIFLLILLHKTIGRIQRNNDFENRIIKYFSAVFLFFMGILTFFILVRHPDLPQQTKKERLQIAAASIILKSDLKGFLNTILKAMTIDPEDEITHLLLADANFINGSFNEAKSHYLKVIVKNKNSSAGLQLDRIEVLTERKVLSKSRLMQKIKKGDPTGEINRWLGIYHLDKLKQPDEAILFFNKSLRINPGQKQAKGMKTLILQHFQQKKRLVSRRIPSESLPQSYHRMLNTHINFVRLNVILLDLQF